jgi:hypothetical protein
MKGITNIQKVEESVNRLAENCTDHLIDTKDVQFIDLEEISISGQRHELRPQAQSLIATRYSIPLPYLKRCSRELQSANLNHWLAKEQNDQMFFRFSGNDVRAVFTPRYRPVDNHEIINRLYDIGYSPETICQSYLDEEFLSINIPDEAKTFGIARNDKIVPGVSICNSEVGVSALKISTYFLRLVCTNGLIGKTQVASSFRHISRKIIIDFPEVMTAVGYSLGRQKDQFRISLESKVDDPQSTMIAFNKQFMLQKIEIEAVNWAWKYEAGHTMFNVVNTYTRAAEYQLISAESSYKLQKVGGDILALLK